MASKEKKGKKRLLPYLIATILIIGGIASYFLFLKPERSSELYSKTEVRPELNVLLITIDTLRADHLSCYGYAKIATPHIDQLAKEGVLFKQTIADVPLTLPSHASILTGTYALYHEVIDNGNYRLQKKHTTIAEIFKQYDYSTSAFISAFVVDSRFGLDQGFDIYYDFDEEIFDEEKALALSEIQRIAEDTTIVFYDWLKKHKNQKFFTWLHLYDPHDPYTPPEPYGSMYKDNLYDGEVAYVDKIIGEIISTLEAMGLLGRTLIIFASDHGEGLGDHKEETHQFFIYDSVMHVPLIFRLPNVLPAGKVIEEQARNIDIVPTILGILKIDRKKFPWLQGTDLTSLMSGQFQELNLDAFCQTEIPRLRFGWSNLHSLRYQGWKYIQAPKPELYNVTADPGELNNIIGQNEAKARELATRLQNVVKKYSASEEEKSPSMPLDAESMQKLQSLGYLSSSSSPSGKVASHIDPKDKIEEFQLVNSSMSGALKDIEQGRYQGAIEKLLKIKNVNPNFDTMHYNLGKAYLASGRPQRAIEEFKETLKINGDFLLAYIDSAKAYVALKDYKTAEAILNSGLSHHKDTHLYHFNLGFIYHMKGDHQSALKEYLAGKELNPNNPQIYSNISSIYMINGDKVKAETYLREALKLNPHMVEANTNLGLLAIEKGHFEEAYQYFKKATESNIRDFRPYLNLGLICQKLGRKEEALQALQKAQEMGADLKEVNARLSQSSRAPQQRETSSFIIRHIIVPTKALADEIYNELKDGANINQLAQKHSLSSPDAISQQYEVKLEDLLEPLQLVVPRLKPGEFSTPIKTSRGYFILQRIE